jgi:hypothetical protein
MGFIGTGEIFLKVKDMGRGLEFCNGRSGLRVDGWDGGRGKDRARFTLDPAGNEAEVNGRHRRGAPKRRRLAPARQR